jgi:DeoR/GlpR family transcriptional regulator of sugar metabolism
MRLQIRQNDILEAVKSTGACSVTELASQLGVSDETIRRHIKPLVIDGLVEKVHGGIVLGEYLTASRQKKSRRVLMKQVSKLSRHNPDTVFTMLSVPEPRLS